MEERLFRDEEMQAEIDQELESVFGMDQLASFDFTSDHDESDDPLATDTNSDCTSDDNDIDCSTRLTVIMSCTDVAFLPHFKISC